MRLRTLPIIGLLCWLQLSLPAVAQPMPLDVVYTGSEGGITGYSLAMEETNLFAAQPDWELTNLTLDVPVYRQGRYALIDPDGNLTAERFRAFFQAGPVHLEGGTKAVFADSNYSQVLQWPPGSDSWALGELFRLNGDPPHLPDLQEKRATLTAVVNAKGQRIWLVRNDGLPRYSLAELSLPGRAAAPSDQTAQAPVASDHAALPAALGSDRAASASDGFAAPPSDAALQPQPAGFGQPDLSAAERWEPAVGANVVFRHKGRDAHLVLMGRMLGTWDRRIAMLRTALHRRRGAVLVGTGNTIDRPRVIASDEAHRQTWEELKTLPYNAFLPSVAEFSLSLPDFRQFSHDLPLVAANVTPPDPEIELPPFRMVKYDSLNVGIVGVVDREALRDAGLARLDAGWKVIDPVKAAQEAVKKAREAGADVVLVVTDLTLRSLDQLSNSLRDVALVVGGGQTYPSDLGLQEEVRFDNAWGARQARTPLTVSPWTMRFGAVRLTLDQDRRHTYPVAYTHQTWRISDNEPGDSRFAWHAAELRDSVQHERTYALLPDVRVVTNAGKGTTSDGWQRYSDTEWTRMAAGLVRETKKAEIVILPKLTLYRRIAGPIPAYMVEGWLAGQDKLLPIELTGAQLNRLRDLDDGKSLVTAGYDAGIGKVDGVALNSAERYRVIVSDRVFGNARFADVFGTIEPPKQTLGELKPMVLDTLHGFRRTVSGYPDAMKEPFQRWMTDDGNRMEPRWAVNFEELGVNALSLQNVNQSAYSKVRNARINTPESSTLGTSGKVALSFNSEVVSWTSRVKALYQQARLTDKVQENADDLVFSSELRLNFWKIPLAGTTIPITPFVLGSYDTEFTPSIDSTTNLPNPLQQDFDGIAGLVASPGLGFQEVKLGTIGRYDAVAKVLRPGLQLATTFERQLFKESPLRLRVTADLRHYFTVTTPTPDQLGFLGDISAALVVPIWQNLNLTVGTNALVYRGQQSTDAWGLSFNPTIGITYGGVWKPQWGVAF